MDQCIKCKCYVYDSPHKGYGECWADRMEKHDYTLPVEIVKDCMEKITCKNYKLGSMAQVRPRSKRNMTFGNDGSVILK